MIDQLDKTVADWMSPRTAHKLTSKRESPSAVHFHSLESMSLPSVGVHCSGRFAILNAAATVAAEKSIALFNGKNLDGWNYHL